ncbi:MAG: hypothetical protein A2426_12690 [Candidatus Lambdaproteobacteria bacterium RIFOXYC1_FULL_56_13]|nr:MAG: hypothetical protein A2426_12690 [Candidatus Lambdaproteobacteria bacterium RIFOXYC1_FULL_56_13]
MLVKTLKLLYGNAAGRCAFPGCNTRVTLSEDVPAPQNIGEMAHICGEKPTASRYDPKQTNKERNGYENLILLCPTHHTLIDKPENESLYTVAALKKFKNDHEQYILSSAGGANFRNRSELANFIAGKLNENHTAFSTYGPASGRARKNPQSDSHKLWFSERLATIIPNNRAILEGLRRNSQLFSPGEQAIVTVFRLHVESYEKWVKDEIEYEAVLSFPKEFLTFIEDIANDSTQ